MGVRSKALRMIVLLAAVGWVGACSFNQPVEEAAQPAGDRPDRATIGADSTAAQDAAAAPDSNGPAQLSHEELLQRDGGGVGIVAERDAASNRYVVDLGKTEPVFDVTMVSNPARIVVDVLGEKSAANKDLQLSDDSYLKSIRLGAHKDRTRIVFDLKSSVTPENLQHEVTTEGGKLVVTLKGQGATAIADAAPATREQLAANDVSAPADAPVAELPAIEAVAPVVDAPVVVADAAPIMPEQPAVEPAVTVAEEIAPQAAPSAKLASEATVNTIAFEKSVNDAGKVVVSTSEPVAFELSKTAPSEYTLNIPGAVPSEQALLPQIAPKGASGIRTVRTSRQGEGTIVRMFVDGGVDLRALANDNSIAIKVDRSMLASRDGSSRAQLEAGDTPTAKGGAKPAAEVKTETKTAGVAAAPNDELARQNPSGLRSADGSKLYTGRLISLDLQDTDIDNALRIIAEVSNLNIIASDDVTGKVTLRLIDVPWDQALDVILKTNGLDQVTEGNVIRIAPIDKLRQEREALREAEKAKQLLEKLTVEYIRVSYARATELKEQVEAVLSERGSVSVDERTNQLIIKDVGDGHNSARELLKRLDLRTPQVLLETQIIESGRNILRDLGFQWNFSYTQSPATGNATGLNFPNSVAIGGANGGNLVSFPAVISDTAGSAVSAVLDSADGSRALSARLSALETERKVKVISRPQVATVNNKQAEISSVETFRVRTPSSGTAISTGSGAQASGSANSAFQEIKVGIELTVTPQASPDYFVLLDVKAKSSTLGPGAAVDNIPPTLDREATSTILVKSGQTFALGGVYRLDDSDQVEGVPFLKDIPFLGQAFRRNFVDKRDEELIFFITPHIVEGSFDPSLM